MVLSGHIYTSEADLAGFNWKISGCYGGRKQGNELASWVVFKWNYFAISYSQAGMELFELFETRGKSVGERWKSKAVEPAFLNYLCVGKQQNSSQIHAYVWLGVFFPKKSWWLNAVGTTYLREFSGIQRIKLYGWQHGVLVCNFSPGPIADLNFNLFRRSTTKNMVKMLTLASVSWLVMASIEP